MKRFVVTYLLTSILLWIPALGQVTYIPEVTETTLLDHVIDLSKPVGHVQGQQGVSATGGATYTMPIAVPPGTNGMQPNLALVYNSQAGDGLLGMGWGLSGLSAIQRTGSTEYHDFRTRPVQWNSEVNDPEQDHLLMDGERLIPEIRTYWETDAVYDKESSPFLEVTSGGTFGTGPAWFKSVARDGTTSWYGEVPDGGSGCLTKRNDGLEVLVWHLSKVEDAFGNGMRFHYAGGGDSEVKHITQIEYSYNVAQNIPAYNTIDFIYGLRSDPFAQYQSGSEFVNAQLLERVEVQAEGVVTAQYFLHYSLRQQQRSYLSEVIQQGTLGTELNSTLFKYWELKSEQVMNHSTTAVVQGQQVDIHLVDLDGNGKDDVLATPYMYHAELDYLKVLTGLRVYMNGSLTSTYAYDFPGTDYACLTVNSAEYSGLNNHLLFPDVNGDGRADLVFSLFHWSYPEEKNFFSGAQVFISQCTTTDADFQLLDIGRPDASLPYGESYSWLHPEAPKPFLFPGDFNGDGKSDIVAHLYTGGWENHRIYTWQYGSGWSAAQTLGGGSANHMGGSEDIVMLDVDGDGKMELLSLNEDESPNGMVITFNGPDWKPIATGGPDSGDPHLQGDFNGDGLCDILAKESEGPTWRIFMSTGTGFLLSPVSLWIDLDLHEIELGDFNGDGRCDIFKGWYSGQDLYATVGYSKGANEGDIGFDLETYSVDEAFWTAITAGDVNGDGKTDILNHHYYNSPIDVYRFHYNSHERRLEKVENGMDHQTVFTYDFATNPLVYTEVSEDHGYPYRDMDLPLPVVRQVKVPNGIGGTTTQTHAYGDGWGWCNGPGFNGFKMHTVTDAAEDRRQVVQLDHFTNVAGLFPQSTQVYDVSTNTQLSGTQTTGTVVITAPGTKRYQYRMLSNTVQDLLAGTARTQQNLTFDAVGNVLSATSDQAGILQSTTANTYLLAGPSPYASRVGTSTVTTTHTGQPSVSATVAYSYDNSTGSLLQEVNFQGTPQPIITSYTYWPTGNVKQTSTAWPGLSATGQRVKQWTYDPKFRFPVTVTRLWYNGGSVNVTDQYTYDARWGSVLSHLAPDGLTTINTYDAFGRLLSTEAPHIAGNPRYQVQHHWEWADAPGTDNIYYKHEVVDPAGPDTRTWYDQLGRVLKEETAAFAAGEWTATTTVYDGQGRVSVTTDPKLSGELPLTRTYTYDAFGRPSTITDSQSGTTQLAYSYANGELTTTTTSPAGHVCSNTTDATGKTTLAHDDGGDLDYTYDSWGNLLKVAHNGNVRVQNTYDAYGRQTSMDEESAGLTQYLYDPFGQVTWQKDAQNNETTFTYDNLGRLRTRTNPEGSTTISYYWQGGRFLDAPVSETGYGVTRTYAYNDPYLRCTQATQTISGFTSSISYAYNNLDQVTSEAYAPANLAVTSTYTPEGYLNQVKHGSTLLFQGNNMNGRGRYTSYALADGQTTTVTYDQAYPTAITAGNKQDLYLSYTYATGNLTSRWDGLKLRKEIFTYDDLDRLTGAATWTTTSGGSTLNNLYAHTYGYDGSPGNTSGNLITRSDVGTYGYYNHAVTSVSNATNDLLPPLGMSTETQDISYTSFHQPLLLSETVGNDHYTLQWAYGPDEHRVKSTLKKNGSVQETRYYHGAYEVQALAGGTTNHILHVGGGEGLCAMIVKSNGVKSIYAVYKDQLGSPVALWTAGANSTLVAEQNFDAWGRRRNPTDWTYENIPGQPDWLYRGYTGHEHVEPFALINLNGRMYDPLNGRMLSVDNYVQGADNTQGYNRYSYALNNPLKYADPDGENPLLVAALIGGFFNWAANGCQFNSTGLQSFLVGAGAGALGAGVGLGLSSALGGGGFMAGALGTSSVSAIGFGAGAVAGAGGGFTGGFINGLGNSLVGGDDMERSLENGLDGGITGALWGGISGGIAGGMAARQGGGRFFGRGTVTKDVVYRDVPRMAQAEGSNDCLAVGGAAMDRSLGGNLDPGTVREWFPGDGAIDNLKFLDAYSAYSGRTNGIMGGDIPYEASNVFREFKAGAGVIFAQSNGTGKAMHALVLQRATKFTYSFLNSVPRYSFRVMNPAGGVFQSYELRPLLDHFMFWTP